MAEWTTVLAVSVALVVVAVTAFMVVFQPKEYDFPQLESDRFWGAWKLFGSYAKKMQVHLFFHDMWKEYGDMYVFEALFNYPAIVITDPDGAREILRSVAGDGDVERSTTGKRGFARFCKNGLLVLEGDKWRSHRHLVLPAFSTSRLRAVSDVTDDVGKELTSRWLAHDPDTVWDVHRELNNMAMQVLLKTVFSLEMDVVNSPNVKVAQALEEMIPQVTRRSRYPKFFHRFLKDEDAFKANRQYLRDYVTYLLRERQAVANSLDKSSDKDVLNLLMKNAVKGEIDEDDMVDEALMFFAAGHETTANTLTWIIFRISQDKELVARMRKEVVEVCGANPDGAIEYDDLPRLELIDAVIKESLRLTPVAPVTSRWLVRDFEIQGKTVPKHFNAVINIYSLHRHPKYWDDPETFNPDRWLEKDFVPRPGSFLPFGSGPQGCIGERLARTEMKSCLARLVREFDFELATDDPEALMNSAEHSITLGLKKGCPVRVRPFAH
eukprot:Clim_evm5s177 gene=Clim_evmTU5s177